ncbi:MAG: hypothetical protein M9931_09950 [Chitinophagales bacterium]|nr:hypothetical protein [Chitinophagales bacterium]MCO5281358.1 hypothetical protein [Chitinophagales bacterium]HRN95240.1 hypothetical protein [Chitinophagales bacterium]HRP39953.1 hypothetical protein [Chitinophagales bacterium]
MSVQGAVIFSIACVAWFAFVDNRFEEYLPTCVDENTCLLSAFFLGRGIS